MFGANLAYLFLFPFFYFAYLGSAAGYWNASSYFGYASIAVVALYGLILPIPVTIRLGASLGKSAAFIILVLWCALRTIWHWLTIRNFPPEAYTQVLEMLLFWAALFFVGLFVDPSRKYIFRLSVVSIAGMLTASGYYMDTSIGLVDLRGAFDADDIPSYQGFASATMLTALILLASIRKLRWRFFWATTCAFLLFVGGARSEFVGYSVAVGVVEGIGLLRRPKVIPAISIALVPVCFFINDRWSDIENSRQMQLFDIANASSWIARQDFLQFAIDQIADHPIEGMFGGHFYWNWPFSAGAYAHNALSAWVSFGLIGFTLYILLTVSCAKSSFALLWQPKMSPVSRLSAYVNILSLLLVIAAKSVFWPIVALGWGLAINSAAKIREINLRAAPQKDITGPEGTVPTGSSTNTD